MSERDQTADSFDRAFGLLQRVLPKQLLSRTMHSLARSTRPSLRNAMIGATLRAYPMIEMSEAVEPDPYAYPSFNAFFITFNTTCTDAYVENTFLVMPLVIAASGFSTACTG